MQTLLLFAFLLFAPTTELRSPNENPQLPKEGRIRAVIVFARFEDDEEVYAGAEPKARAWSDPDRLPGFADRLLSSSSKPPFGEHTLTDYYFRQSQGQLILYGEPYPKIVVVAGNEFDYLMGSPWIRRDLITEQLLNVINADENFDLGEFDGDDDGYLDYVFVVLRRIRKHQFFGGAAGISGIGFSSPSPVYGRDTSNLKMARAKLGAYIRYNSEGIALPQMDLIRLMAHEVGHGIWTALSSGHLRPELNPLGVPEGHSERIGYALMVGRAAGRWAAAQPVDIRGTHTISAIERESLGRDWINCATLEEDTDDVRIGDLYSSRAGNCYKLRISDAAGSDRTLYLSNLQRIGYFDRQHRDAALSWYTAGLQTTGLLVMAARSESGAGDPFVAVVAADNTLALNDSAYTYEGDLFGPETKLQLTPWTRPNIAAYATSLPNHAMCDAHFQAIDNIRYSGGPGNEMAFDYVRDFRQRPVIREDSWMGPETSGFEFTGDMLVTGGSTLTIGTDVRVASALVIDEGSTVVVTGQLILTQSSVLKMAPGSCLTGSGQVTLHGVLDADDSARLDFQVGPGEGEVSRVARRFALEQNHPNPFTSSTSISFDVAQPVDLTLTVYDVLGRQVSLAASGTRLAGMHEVSFNATGLPSGVYFYRLEAGDYVETKRMVVIRL
jgi:hypothetical protein